MIDERLIENEILKRIIVSGEFTSANMAYTNNKFNPAGLSLWAKFVFDPITASERRSSNTMISCSYIATIRVRVPANDSTDNLNIKKKALLELFDPRKTENKYFVIDGAKVNISEVESLSKSPFETSWFQGGVQLIINANQI